VLIIRKTYCLAGAAGSTGANRFRRQKSDMLAPEATLPKPKQILAHLLERHGRSRFIPGHARAPVRRAPRRNRPQRRLAGYVQFRIRGNFGHKSHRLLAHGATTQLLGYIMGSRNSSCPTAAWYHTFQRRTG